MSHVIHGGRAAGPEISGQEPACELQKEQGGLCNGCSEGGERSGRRWAGAAGKADHVASGGPIGLKQSGSHKS